MNLIETNLMWANKISYLIRFSNLDALKTSLIQFELKSFPTVKILKIKRIPVNGFCMDRRKRKMRDLNHLRV